MISTKEFINEQQQTSRNGANEMKKNPSYGSYGLECNQNYHVMNRNVDEDSEDLEAMEEEVLSMQEEVEVLRRIAALLVENFSQMGLKIEDLRVHLEDSKKTPKSRACEWAEKIEESKNEEKCSQKLMKLLNSTKDLVEHRSYFQTNYPMEYVHDIEGYLLIRDNFDAIEYFKRVQRLRSVLTKAEPPKTCGKVKLPLPSKRDFLFKLVSNYILITMLAKRDSLICCIHTS